MEENPYEPPKVPSDGQSEKKRVDVDGLLAVTVLVSLGSLIGFFAGFADESLHEGITLVVGGLVGAAIYGAGRWLLGSVT